MSVEIGQCPYWGRALLLDEGRRAAALRSAGAGAGPCRHLVFVWAEVVPLRGGRECRRDARGAEGAWLWERGRGLRRHRGIADGPLSGYLLDHARGFLEPHEQIAVEHQVVGGTAEEREEARPGTGHFTLAGRNGAARAALHAWAVFSPAPGAFAAGVRRLLV